MLKGSLRRLGNHRESSIFEEDQQKCSHSSPLIKPSFAETVSTRKSQLFSSVWASTNRSEREDTQTQKALHASATIEQSILPRRVEKKEKVGKENFVLSSKETSPKK